MTLTVGNRLRLSALFPTYGGLAIAALAAGLLSAAAAGEEPEEYQYQIFVGNADGSDMKRLVNLPEYQSQGSPDWSEDGKLIAFDAWKPQLGEQYFNGHIFVVHADGTKVRDLGPGNTPSLSPQGHRVACSKQGEGIWVIDVDSPDLQAQLDTQGWGTDWSPDGTRIAYARGDNLIIYSLVEGTSEPVFKTAPRPFRHVLWNFVWSSDSREIAFKGMLADGNKPVLAIVDARGAEHGLRILYEGEIQPALTWHPNRQQILVTINDPMRDDFPQLFRIDVENPGKPTLLEQQPIDRKLGDPSYSPDGKKLAVRAFKREPQGSK